MKQNPFRYQLDAVNECINHLQTNKTFKLQAPTGSGKTLITSLIISEYLLDDRLSCNKTSFIYIAPSTGQLDKQGQEKIQSYIDNGTAFGFSTEYIGSSNSKGNYLKNIDYFQENTVYFIGWQMFKKGTKITNVNSERNDIYRVINNTKNRNIKIVLIIDEAHREVKFNKNDVTVKTEILEKLDPFKQIELSATFDNKPDYAISYTDVREECAIKQNITIAKINDDIDDIKKCDEETQLILSAIAKQKEIKKLYHKKDIKINPLILIQIPDNINIDNGLINTEEQLNKKIEIILEDYQSKNNDPIKYAYWLSDKKTIKDKKEITKNDSEIDILIFKTAIATGWDIPRANILVRIRESKKESFNIQTLGRILRNPLLKYYNNELIDNGFVFTKDDDYKNLIKQETIVNDNDDYKTVDRSPNSKKSVLKMNKVLIKKSESFNEQNLITTVSDIIIQNDVFKKYFLAKIDFLNLNSVSFNISSELILKSKNESEIKELNREARFNGNQLQINDNSTNKPIITLFDLYVKFRTITKSSKYISSILDKISEKMNSIGLNKKHFYWCCIERWNDQKFKFESNELSFKDWIKSLINKYINDNSSDTLEIYELPLSYKVKSDNELEWDKVNTFNYSLNYDLLDSKNEENFYRDIKSFLKYNKEHICHLFRNGTSSNDYYIEYYDNNDEIKKFFPDFLFVNESEQTYYIIEAKDWNDQNNIDRNSKQKFARLKRICRDIQINYKFLGALRVFTNNKDDVKCVNETNDSISKEALNLDEILFKC